jgi:hypothetical protein
MKILAFLQNQWVNEPERVRASIEKYGEKYRRRFIAFALFSGCSTGRRLRSSFGDLCDQIIWEEASPKIGGHSSSFFVPDKNHISQRIDEESPDVILAFGAAACAAVQKTLSKRLDGPCIEFIQLPHPVARHTGLMELLKKTGAYLRARNQL